MMRNDNNIYINTWITDEKKLHIKGRLTGLKVSRLEFESDSYDAVMTFFILFYIDLCWASDKSCIIIITRQQSITSWSTFKKKKSTKIASRRFMSASFVAPFYYIVYLERLRSIWNYRSYPVLNSVLFGIEHCMLEYPLLFLSFFLSSNDIAFIVTCITIRCNSAPQTSRAHGRTAEFLP